MNKMGQDKTGLKVPKDKKILLLLAIVFVLPFTLAFVLHLLDIRPGGKSFGQLVTPPIELTIPPFTTTNGKDFSADQWSKIWNIVIIEQADCNAACEQKIDKMDRVQRTLHKDKDRVQLVLMLKGNANAERVKQLESQFADLVVLPVQQDVQQAFAEQFTKIAPEGSIYLVDPLNNLMMQYPSDIEPKAFRADVKKLLKNSWGG
jgi:cytochrome oxidase Cu insertion factor (SCO1/SenC/PrrC family)